MRASDRKRWLSAVGVPISRDEAPPLALAMADLYLECVRQLLLPGDIDFHLLLMSGMNGTTVVYSGFKDDDMDVDVAELLNESVADRDCVVLLGDDLLGRERGEKEMLEVAVVDVARHLTSVERIYQGSRCKVHKPIGFAAIASTLAAAHDAIHLDRRRSALNLAIADRAKREIDSAARLDSEIDLQTSRYGKRLVDTICMEALKSRGRYITLPNEAPVIALVAKEMGLEVAQVDPVAR